MWKIPAAVHFMVKHALCPVFPERNAVGFSHLSPVFRLSVNGVWEQRHVSVERDGREEQVARSGLSEGACLRSETNRSPAAFLLGRPGRPAGRLGDRDGLTMHEEGARDKTAATRENHGKGTAARQNKAHRNVLKGQLWAQTAPRSVALSPTGTTARDTFHRTQAGDYLTN